MPGSLIVIGILAFLALLTILLGVRIVPQGYKHVVQRLGKYHATLNPGLYFVIPYLDSIAHNVLTKDISLDMWSWTSSTTTPTPTARTRARSSIASCPATTTAWGATAASRAPPAAATPRPSTR